MDLDVDAAAVEAALTNLSAEERRWADRPRQPHHRRQFIVTRAALRQVLSEALGVAPQAVALAAGEHGKPRLASGGLQFNLSHSGGLALIAVSTHHPVGVDVEQAGRGVGELDDMAGVYFSTQEQAAYFALPTADRSDAFFRCWTRKEAVAKALGLGMSLPGPSFAVSLPAADPHLLRLGDEAATGWSLIDLDLPRGYVGALAVPAPGLGVIMRRLEAGPLLRCA